MASAERIVAVGDAAMVLELSSATLPDPAVNARAVAIAARIEDARIAGVREVVPTFQTVGVYFDPVKIDREALSALLREEAAGPGEPAIEPAVAPVAHHIPVWYGGAFGPDLAAVAAAAGLTEQEVVSLHAGAIYRVFMLGFVPGFAYMGVVAPPIAVPRRATPRAAVSAGSVAIAGSQTGVYPSDSPGGWQVIGRTPIKTFDPGRTNPFLFRAGDSVRFDAVDPPGSGR